MTIPAIEEGIPDPVAMEKTDMEQSDSVGLWPTPSRLRNPTLVALRGVRETLSTVHAEIFRKLDDVTRRVTSTCPHVFVFFPPRANFAKIVFFFNTGTFSIMFHFFSSCSLQEIRQLRPMETQSIELVGSPGSRGPLSPVTLAKRQKQQV